jgi:hypothetical protein
LILEAAAAPAATGVIEVTPAVVKAARRLEGRGISVLEHLRHHTQDGSAFLRPHRPFLFRTDGTFDY